MRCPIAWVLLLAIPLWSQTSKKSGIEMTVRLTFDGHSTDQKRYVEADRKRVESRTASGRRKPDGTTEWLVGPRLAMITRCDIGQIFELNLDAGEYDSTAYPPKPWTIEQMKARRPTLPDLSRAGARTLRIETTTVDTGERKEFFGHSARHVVTTRKQIPLEGSLHEPQETRTDGWYIDLRPQVSCEPVARAGKSGHGYLASGASAREKVEFIDIGQPETGFGVQLTITTKGAYKLGDGSPKSYESRTETQVTELREGVLDPALFEIPAGFQRVAHIERNPQEAQSSTLLEEIWRRLKSFLD